MLACWRIWIGVGLGGGLGMATRRDVRHVLWNWMCLCTVWVCVCVLKIQNDAATHSRQTHKRDNCAWACVGSRWRMMWWWWWCCCCVRLCWERSAQMMIGNCYILWPSWRKLSVQALLCDCCMMNSRMRRCRVAYSRDSLCVLCGCVHMSHNIMNGRIDGRMDGRRKRATTRWRDSFTWHHAPQGFRGWGSAERLDMLVEVVSQHKTYPRYE